MPFVKVDVRQQIEEQRENDHEFRKTWDESRTEYKLIGEMISLRKQEKITQKELVKLIGSNQQAISQIERKGFHPTIKLFSKILDVLGYELKIVKKEIM